MADFRIERRSVGLLRWRVVGDDMATVGAIWTDTFLTRRGAERFIARHTWTGDGADAGTPDRTRDVPAAAPDKELLVEAARAGRRATLDPSAFVARENYGDGDYARLDQWQERALLAAVDKLLRTDESTR